MKNFLNFLIDLIKLENKIPSHISEGSFSYIDIDELLINSYNQYMKHKKDKGKALSKFIVDEVSLPWEEVPLTIQKAIKELSDLVVIYGAEVVYDY